MVPLSHRLGWSGPPFHEWLRFLSSTGRGIKKEKEMERNKENKNKNKKKSKDNNKQTKKNPNLFLPRSHKTQRNSTLSPPTSPTNSMNIRLGSLRQVKINNSPQSLKINPPSDTIGFVRKFALWGREGGGRRGVGEVRRWRG